MALKWENLSFSGKSAIFDKILPKYLVGKEKLILDSINGYINDQSLVALMGPSGAGKSTLLKCLCNGYQYNGFSGDIFISNQSKACFITQSEAEHLLMRLTVKESLFYASKLKNIGNEEKFDHEKNVEALLNKLDLQICRNNVVSNCSGGQRKRLAIGLELVSKTKPNFLLLDEPTSGLDSFNGFKVCFMILINISNYI